MGERVSDLMRLLLFVFLLNIATMSRQSPQSGPQRRQSTVAAPVDAIFVCLADADLVIDAPRDARRVSVPIAIDNRLQSAANVTRTDRRMRIK